MNKLRGEIQCGKESINGIVIDPSEEFGFGASSDGMIYIMDFLKNKIEHKVKGHEGIV